MRSEFVQQGKTRWFHLAGFERRLGKRPAQAFFAFVNGLLSISLLAALAMWRDQPLIFPSLGPTAFLLFYTPLAPGASPRNTLFGHLIAVFCGYGSLVLFGLTDDGPALMTGITEARVGATALSLAATAGLMVLFSVEHPPAGATTLIVSLGILRHPRELVSLMAAVVLLCIQGWVINRLAGIPYPLWRARPPKQANSEPAQPPAGSVP
ncbi:MAG: HPP family protein [Isosphaeraceae bacterium]